MASAAWEEVESQWLIWSLGATVALPDERRWLLAIASFGEGGQAGLEEEAVGCCLCGFASFELVKLLRVGRTKVEGSEWQGQSLSQPDEGNDRKNDVKLHSEE